MKYSAIIKVPTVVEIEASSEEDAVSLIRENLIQTQQIKPADPVDISVVAEVKL